MRGTKRSRLWSPALGYPVSCTASAPPSGSGAHPPGAHLAWLLLHRKGHSVRGGGSGARGLERVIAISALSRHLNRALIESRVAGQNLRADHLGIGAADLHADRACIVLLV